MVIISTDNNNYDINGFDFEKTWFLTKHINTCNMYYVQLCTKNIT